MLSPTHRFTRHRHTLGQGIVEFALLLPILLLLIVGVFDLGRAFHALITITNAAREGARYGTLHASDEDGMVQAAVNEAAGSGIDITTGDVDISCTEVNGRCVRGGALTVTVHYTFESILNLFIPTTIDMQRSIVMDVQ
jgi:Flp pilus assembly protein TadG